MMATQYSTRRDPEGWTVFDSWTGETVVLDNSAQAGLSWADADELAGRLSRQRLDGDRSILQ